MNRQTILASVHRQLRESHAETGQVRPLGEIVSRVAADIRPPGRSARSTSQAANVAAVIPLEQVAAFVDGQLRPAETEAICQAVMTDNSVLAEIIAAVRATQQPIEDLPPLPPSLAAQLLAMRQTIPVERTPSEPPRSDREAPEIEVQLVPAPPANAIQIGGRRVAIAAVTLAVAASIVAAIVVTRGGGDSARQDQPMVVDNGSRRGVPGRGDVAEIAPDRTDPPPTPEAVDNTADDRIAKTPAASASPTEADSPAEKDQVAPQTPAVVPGPPPMVANVETETTPPRERDGITPSAPAPSEQVPRSVPQPARIADAGPSMASLRWTEVSGILAQQDPGSQSPGSRRGASWKGIQAGSPSSAAQSDTVALRTLPFSRATAELPSGGRLVISPDTGLQVTRRGGGPAADVDLMYGSIAMVDLAPGTLVRFREGAETLATLRWESKASAVVGRSAAGLQIQVDGGPIEINHTVVRGEAVQVRGDKIEKTRAPKRLPRWVTRGDESTESERMLLAQLAGSDDLTSGLNRKIASLASSPTLRRDDVQLLAKLANWQAALSGPALFRLAGSRIPAVRVAALQRLAQLSENDPRYQRTWTAIDQSVNNPQRSSQMRAWCRLLRSGGRPDPVQLRQMLNGLSARDPAGRAICDFMLRKYVRNPPPFDPSWSGQRLMRAIQLYRQRAGLPTDRVRANASGVRS